MLNQSYNQEQNITELNDKKINEGEQEEDEQDKILKSYYKKYSKIISKEEIRTQTRNINLKDIKENDIILENYEKQVYINGKYINVNNLEFCNNFTKLIYFNNYQLYNKMLKCKTKSFEREDVLNNYICYYTYMNIHQFYNIKTEQFNLNKIDYNLNNYILNVIIYYVLNYNQDKLQNLIDLLDINLIYTKINHTSLNSQNINKLLFNKDLFEKIYYNLELNIQIKLQNLISEQKIKSFDIQPTTKINIHYNFYNSQDTQDTQDTQNDLKDNNDNYIFKIINTSNPKQKNIYLNSSNNIFNSYYKETLNINCMPIDKIYFKEDSYDDENKKILDEYEKRIYEDILKIIDDDKQLVKDKKELTLIDFLEKQIKDKTTLIMNDNKNLFDKNKILIEENKSLIDINKKLKEEIYLLKSKINELTIIEQKYNNLKKIFDNK